MKREPIEYMEVIDEVDKADGKRRKTDAELLEETACIYLEPAQLLSCFWWVLKLRAKWRLKALWRVVTFKPAPF